MGAVFHLSSILGTSQHPSLGLGLGGSEMVTAGPTPTDSSGSRCEGEVFLTEEDGAGGGR